MIKAIVFDLDGTLVDTDELVKKSYTHLFKIYRKDFNLTDDVLNSFLGPTLKEMFPKYFKEDFDILEKAYHEYAYAHTKEFAHLYPYAEDVIKELKRRGYKIGLVTSRLKESLIQMVETLNIKNLFDAFISLDDVSKAKPSGEGIIKICKIFNIKPEECFYLGDNLTDYLAAEDAHAQGGLVTYVNRDLKNYPIKIEISSFLDLLNLFPGVDNEKD